MAAAVGAARRMRPLSAPEALRAGGHAPSARRVRRAGPCALAVAPQSASRAQNAGLRVRHSARAAPCAASRAGGAGGDGGVQETEPTTPATRLAYACLLGSPLLAGPLEALDLPLRGQAYFLALAATAIFLGAERSIRQKPPPPLGRKQALAAPLLASASLFSFYLLIRYTELDPKFFLQAYFGLVGVSCAFAAFSPPLRAWAPGALGEATVEVIPPTWLVYDGDDDEGEKTPVEAEAAPSDLAALALAVALVWHTAANPGDWSLSNVVTIAVASELMAIVSVGSFANCALLLSGLLLYDAFWVYASPMVVGENVMVTVATSQTFDGPTKLLFPSAHPEIMPFSILGAGDVVVPGLLLCLLRRVDNQAAARAADAAPTKGGVGGWRGRLASLAAVGNDGATGIEPEQKPLFFPVGLAAYVVGTTVTVAVNVLTGSPQPALVWIVPCVLGFPLAAAALTGRTVRQRKRAQRSVLGYCAPICLRFLAANALGCVFRRRAPQNTSSSFAKRQSRSH